MDCDHTHFYYNKTVLVQKKLGPFCASIQCVANISAICCVGNVVCWDVQLYFSFQKISLWNDNKEMRCWQYCPLARCSWLLLSLDHICYLSQIPFFQDDGALHCRLCCMQFRAAGALTLAAVPEIALWLKSFCTWPGENMSAFPYPEGCLLCVFCDKSQVALQRTLPVCYSHQTVMSANCKCSAISTGPL